MIALYTFLALALAADGVVLAQGGHQPDTHPSASDSAKPSPESDESPGPVPPDVPAGASMSMMDMTGSFGSYPMTRDASGSSWQPDVTPHMMGHEMRGGWMIMGHMMFIGVYDW